MAFSGIRLIGYNNKNGKDYHPRYKNVHEGASYLKAVEFIPRTADDLVFAPWDVVDAHFQLVD